MDVLTLEGEGAVPAAAAALATVLGARVRPLAASGDGARPAAARLLAGLDDPQVVAAAVRAATNPRAACWQVMARSAKPVLLVPPALPQQRRTIDRALLPLDGTARSAEAVRGVARLLASAGVELLVLHVFDATTVPMFWDQRAHAHRAFTDEFLARAGAPQGTRLELRSGQPAVHVLQVARKADVDLIALGWSQCMDTGRARTVRESVLHASVPVLLVPVGSGPGTEENNR